MIQPKRIPPLRLLAASLATLSCLPAHAQVPPGSVPVDVTYRLQDSSPTTAPGLVPGKFLLPQGWTSGDTTSYALVLFLHGRGEYGTNNTNQINKNVGELLKRGYEGSTAGSPEKFFIYAPQAATMDWDQGEMDSVYRRLARLLREYKVKPAQVYISGISNGGGWTYYGVREYSEVFAASVLLSAWRGPAFDATNMKNEFMWIFHARGDSVVSEGDSRFAVNQIRSKFSKGAVSPWPTTGDWHYHNNSTYWTDTGMALKYTEHGGGGHTETYWDRVYSTVDGSNPSDPQAASNFDNLYRWMINKTNANATPRLNTGETMLFDFGPTEVTIDTAGRTWNSGGPNGLEKTYMPAYPFAKLSDGARRFVHCETGDWNGTTGAFTGGTYTDGYIAGNLYDDNIAADGWKTGSVSEVGRITFTGLNANQYYNVKCFAARSDITGTHFTRYTAGTNNITGELQMENNNSSLTLTGARANSNGALELQVQAGSGNSVAGYIAAVELTRGTAPTPPTTTVYSQSFSSGLDETVYVTASNPPSDDLSHLDGVTVEDNSTDSSIASADGGAIRAVRNSTAAAAGFMRLQTATNTPTAVIFSFDLKVTGTHSVFTDLAILDLANMSTNSTSYSGGLPNGNVGNRLTIKAASGGKIRFLINGIETTYKDLGQKYRITWIQNIGTGTISYAPPDGGAVQTVGPGKADLWIGTTRELDEMDRPTTFTATSIGGFRVRVPTLEALNFYFDNITLEKY